jgi:uncharacterized repeat protein (TIGR02543 family)
MVQTDSIAAGSNYTIRTNGFTKAGYVFAGWKDGNNQSYAVDATINNVSANITLTAQWISLEQQLAFLQAHINDLQADSVSKQEQISTLQEQLAALPDTVYVPQNVYVHDTINITEQFAISVSGASMSPSVFNPFITNYTLNLSNTQPTVMSVMLGNISYNIIIPNATNGTTAVVGAQSLAPLQIYPNPVSDQLTVAGDQWNAGDKVEIYNVNGGLAGVYNVSGGASTTINIANLPAGVYIVKVGNKAAKIVKQ